MKKTASAIAGLILILSFSLNVFFAQAQDAKSYFEKAKSPDLDQCTRLQLVCKAAELDAKKKEYRDACNNTRIALIASDRDSLKRAHDFLDASNLKSASRYAGYVCKYNEVQYADAQQILQQVKKLEVAASAPPTPAAAPAKQDQNALFYSQAETQFEQGNFAAASSAANQVTDPNLKSLANQILQKIANYNAALQDAQQKERNKDYDGAVKAYEAALQFAQAGPGDPAAHIRDDERAEQQAAAGVATAAPPPQAVPQPAPSTATNKGASAVKPAVEDDSVKVARILDEAGKDVQANNLQAALKAYEAALRIQPTNTIADAGRKDVQAAINRDPAEQAKTLSQAIRDFYNSKYSETEDELTTYLSSTTARSRGAAYFYLGATRLCVAILQTPGQKAASAINKPEVQRPFKEARAANYQPLAKYVSPVVMRAWESSLSAAASGNSL